jgi:hypothetical protein
MYEQLKERLTDAFEAAQYSDALDLLAEFSRQGGEQFHAYEILKELRASDLYDEDSLLHLMDSVSGWCGVNRRIWPHKLGTRVCLLIVAGFETKSGLKVLQPGISQSRIGEYHLGWVKQGTELNLLYPDGTVCTTTLEGYHIDVAAGAPCDSQLETAPIFIKVLDSVRTPIGTEIWCVRPS